MDPGHEQLHMHHCASQHLPGVCFRGLLGLLFVFASVLHALDHRNRVHMVSLHVAAESGRGLRGTNVEVHIPGCQGSRMTQE